MPRIKVGRYAHPDTHGYAGWIEPETGEWIAFVSQQGAIELYDQRDETGAIVE